MPKGVFDGEGFYAALDGHRISRRLTWKKVAQESGVSASTLTRMAQGRRPDVDTLAALLNWSGESADNYILSTGFNEMRKESPLAVATAQFRRDPNLPPEAKKAIESTLKALYQHFSSDGKE